ncbi:MAG: phosphotransferase [Deltaproteobacteria bacterium]|nr:phosphotransferase [Deltaproteobacteria bacterium]
MTGTPTEAPRPWAVEEPVDAARAAALIAAQVPELAGAEVVPWGQGWDNAAFLVGGVWVFRFPQRAVAAPLLEREVRALPRVADAVPVRITAPSWVGRPSAAYPWWFAGYRVVPGATLDRAGLDDAARGTLVPALAAFLRALHGLDATPFREDGVPGDEIGRLDVVARVPQMLERLDVLGDRVDQAALTAVVRDLEARLRASPPALGTDTVVHGDLYSRHLVVADDGALAGVIDWGDLHVGDPAVDLAVAHLVLPDDARDAFRAAYGGVDEATWTLARFRAVQHAIATAWYAGEVGDDAFFVESAAALRRLARG